MPNKMVNIFKIYDDLLRIMINGEDLPLDVLHICGSRYCSKSFSTEDFIIRALLTVKGCSATAIRNEVNMASELFKEYKDMSDDAYGGILKSNKTERTLVYGKNEFKCRGLKGTEAKGSAKIKKAGLAKARDAKYIIYHVEEAYEIDIREKDDLKLSLRSNDQTQVLEINTCNPASMGNDYIKYLNKHFKFNREELRTKGFQWSGIIDVKKATPDGDIISREAFLYVNWRAVEEVLSKNIINQIKATWELDPNRAQVVDYGMPGDIQGTIFGELVKKVQPVQLLAMERLSIGVDYGWGTSGNRSPTSAWFLGSTPERQGFQLFERYYHDNKSQYLDTQNQINRLLTWAWACRDKYIKLGLISKNKEIEIRFDNAHVGVIDSLRKELMERVANTYDPRRQEWMVFKVIPCDTKNVITKITQIEIMRMAFASGMITVNQQSKAVMDGLDELSLITWENEKEEKMEHTHSHDFDAIIYGIGAQDLRIAMRREPAYFIFNKQGLNNV